MSARDILYESNGRFDNIDSFWNNERRDITLALH